MDVFVLGFAIDADYLENILLMLKRKPKWQYRNGIGGKVEADETFVEAMIREFKEKTGIVTDKIQWKREFNITFEDCILIVFSNTSLLYKELEDAAKNEHAWGKEEPLSIIHFDLLKNYELVHNLNWMIPLIMDNSIKKPINMHEKPFDESN